MTTEKNTFFGLAFMYQTHFGLFSTILTSKLSSLELGDICIIVCLSSMIGCTVHLVGALRAQGAWTMHTLSGVDRWSGDRGKGFGAGGYIFAPRPPSGLIHSCMWLAVQ